ncbi:hypothetical protein POTOM_007687 [Populus tomentosa]|uniref:3-methyl-2-oxobutanoate dehydrogenase (2-methylpropanoyl-transferring) n=1 Tax=Populus tomentosa TaxID=118781 RepID=A0A8X8AKK8_POPTO|nr:hypothetical protein POTOM_007687 [Populus tomentosa]
MAVWLAKSRTITHHLKRKVGFMGIFHQDLWTSSSSSCMQPGPLSSIFIPGFHEHQNSSTPRLFPFNSSISTRFSLHRFKSTKAASQLEHLYSSTDDDDHDNSQDLDFPGGKVACISEMRFLPESAGKRIPCYRVLDDNGEIIVGSDYEQLCEEIAVKMYTNMVSLQMMDTMFYEAQRQGRISFYMTSTGEEAINIASAAALSADDIVLPQYREPGILLWRGFTIEEFASQCFGNEDDCGKGRQMPMHYGSKKHNFVTISSPIATQLSQAVGVAYSLKMDKKDACVVTYTGDGGTSEGDFHAALNFAAVTEAPVVFICRNNGWAISTNISEQFRSAILISYLLTLPFLFSSDGIVVRGQAYGIRSIRVDGNDALAVYSAIHTAREMAISEQRPVLVEALSYRVGHHSTSDDSTKYRSVDEIEYWKMVRNPVNRFRKWVERNGWWSEEEESELRSSMKKQLLQVIQVAEKKEKPPLKELFSDVYDITPPNLREQEKQLRETIIRHPQDYPSDVPL